MGVFRGRGAIVDTLAISQEMRKSVRQWESALVAIINPGPNDTWLRDKNNAAFIWSGMARVQPYRREVGTATVTNPTTNQSVRFQIDFSQDGVIPDILTGWQVIVLPESLTGIELPDPYISSYQHVVRSNLNSSQAWIRTIETQVNTERRVNWGAAIETNGSGGWQWVV